MPRTRTKFAVQPRAGRRLADAAWAHVEVVLAGEHVAPARLGVESLVDPAHVGAGLAVAAREGAERGVGGVAVARIENALVAFGTHVFFVRGCDGVQSPCEGGGRVVWWFLSLLIRHISKRAMTDSWIHKTNYFEFREKVGHVSLQPMN